MRLLAVLPLLAAPALLGCSTKPPSGDPSRPAPSATATSAAITPPAIPSGIVDMDTRAFLRRRSADGLWHNELLATHGDHGEIFHDIVPAGADVYAIGYAYTGVDGPDDGIIYKRQSDGRWQKVFESRLKELGSGWASGPSDVYASGFVVVHFDGTSWRTLDIGGPTRTSYRISGSGPKDVLAFGSTGTVYRLQEKGTWEPEADLKAPINDGLVIDADTAYAVSDGGVVFHRVKATWKKEDAGVRDQLTRLWASGANDIYAAGGALVHSTGDGKWTPIVVPRIGQPTKVAGRAANDVWALGLGGMAHYDGTRWEPLSLDTVQPSGVKGMVALDSLALTAGDLFVAGDVTTAR